MATKTKIEKKQTVSGKPQFDEYDLGHVFYSTYSGEEVLLMITEDGDASLFAVGLHPETWSGCNFSEKELSGYRPVTTITYTVEA